MSLQRKSQEIHLDDRLAEFTDDVLVGNVTDTPNPDEELFDLEQTILRLKNAYPPLEVSEARIKQMHVRLKNRVKRDDLKSDLPFWRRWLGATRTRPLFGMAAAMVSVLLVFVFLAPLLSPAGSSTTAFALDSAQGTLCAGIAVIILFVWIVRRK